MKKQLLIMALGLSACGVPQSDYDALNAKYEAAKIEIEDLKNGEERLLNLMRGSLEAGDNNAAFDAAQSLIERHTGTTSAAEAVKVKAKIEGIRAIEAEKKLAEKKELERKANLNNTGIWQVVSYVDDFGDPTDEKYIRNTQHISGRFSNSATENSRLNVRFLIDGSNKVSIMLYEYAGNNPVKAYSPDKYLVLLRDSKGNKSKLNATNHLDRLTFGPSHSKIVFNALKQGGDVEFRIVEIDTPTTQYSFNVADASYFDNAARMLSEK